MMDLNHLPVLSRLTMPLIACSLRSGRISFKRGGASLYDELWKDNLGFIASLLFLSSPVHVCLLQIHIDIETPLAFSIILLSTNTRNYIDAAIGWVAAE